MSTGLLAAFILPGIFFLTQEFAKEGRRHLGIPDRLGYEVGIAAFIAGVVLILPIFSKRIKERAYVGLGIVYISALIGHLAIDGPIAMSFSPLVTLTLLIISYITYHRLQKH